MPKHKVKETWTGADSDAQLWHFGQPFEEFERSMAKLANGGWRPNLIYITSLTSVLAQKYREASS